MLYKKDNMTVFTLFSSVADLLERNGWEKDESEVSLPERVEALEDAVIDIATEVYGND